MAYDEALALAQREIEKLRAENAWLLEVVKHAGPHRPCVELIETEIDGVRYALQIVDVSLGRILVDIPKNLGLSLIHI